MTSIGLPYAPARVLPVRYEQDDGTTVTINAYFVTCPVCGEQFQGADPSLGRKDTDLTGRERLTARTPEDQITKSAADKYARHFQKAHVGHVDSSEPEPDWGDWGDPDVLSEADLARCKALAPSFHAQLEAATTRHQPACEAGRDSRGCRGCAADAAAAQALNEFLDTYPNQGDPDE